MVSATFNFNPNYPTIPSKLNTTYVYWSGEQGNCHQELCWAYDLWLLHWGDDVQMSSLAWSLLVTENQRAGDTSDTDCSTRSGETQAQASSETGDCNAGPGRCERCERVLRTRAGRVTHMRL